jgi:hypothetical protein
LSRVETVVCDRRVSLVFNESESRPLDSYDFDFLREMFALGQMLGYSRGVDVVWTPAELQSLGSGRVAEKLYA